MEVKMPENAGVFSESESAGVFRILTWSEEDFESSVVLRIVSFGIQTVDPRSIL